MADATLGLARDAGRHGGAGVVRRCPTVKAFTLACAARWKGCAICETSRSQIAAATAPPPTPRPSTPPPTMPPPTPTPVRTPPHHGCAGDAPPTATPSLPHPDANPAPPPQPRPPAAYIWLREVSGKIAVTAIGAFARVKEADAVAYPAHVVAAYVLDGAGCGEDAVRIQWLKAGLHAAREGQPEHMPRRSMRVPLTPRPGTASADRADLGRAPALEPPDAPGAGRLRGAEHLSLAVGAMAATSRRSCIWQVSAHSERMAKS